MDGDRRNSHLLAGAVDAKCNFAAVGDQDLLEHHERIRSAWPNSTGSASRTQISDTVPLLGARMGFIVFMASTIRSVSPSFTASPTLTNGGAAGWGAPSTV